MTPAAVGQPSEMRGIVLLYSLKRFPNYLLPIHQPFQINLPSKTKQMFQQMFAFQAAFCDTLMGLLNDLAYEVSADDFRPCHLAAFFCFG
jgi:hypothetical protein